MKNVAAIALVLLAGCGTVAEAIPVSSPMSVSSTASTSLLPQTPAGGERPYSSTSPTGTPITDKQAQILAGALVANLADEGADVTVHIPVSDGDLRLTGVVNWVEFMGRFDFVAVPRSPLPSGAPGVDIKPVVYAFTASKVWSSEDGGASWDRRTADPKQYPVDVVLALTLALSSAEAENALLLRDAGTEFLGSDPATGGAFVFRRPDQSVVWWVDPVTGNAVAVEMPLQIMGGAKARVEMSGFGPKTIAPPAGVVRDIDPGPPTTDATTASTTAPK